MPQFNPEFFISQLFWLIVFFSILFIFLWKVSLPRISTVLEKRQGKIDENLSNAKELQKRAQDIEIKINTKINSAKDETDQHIKNTIVSLQNDISAKLLTLDKELEEKISNSEKEIARNKEIQMKNINEEIKNITKITVAKVSDISISDDEVNKAISAIKGNVN